MMAEVASSSNGGGSWSCHLGEQFSMILLKRIAREVVHGFSSCNLDASECGLSLEDTGGMT
jgi:hypothetical protein